jgi:hypothetical protein
MQIFVDSIGERCFKRVFELKDQIGEYVARKGNPFPQFSDPEWILDTCLISPCISVTRKCDCKANISLYTFCITNFFMTSHIFQSYHIESLLTLRILHNPFCSQIWVQLKVPDLKSNKTLRKTLSAPFRMDVEDALWIMQVEFIDMQC